MVCQYLDDLWELYLLGVLGVVDANTATEHLTTGCPHCLGQLREAALAAYFLCLPDKTHRPAPQAKSNLLRRLKQR